ncbi:MAG: M15 family metallopeptidase [Bacteroidales bacterium]|nr:M15 family metallopeptidase [Bacteroidales bacterium]
MIFLLILITESCNQPKQEEQISKHTSTDSLKESTSNYSHQDTSVAEVLSKDSLSGETTLNDFYKKMLDSLGFINLHTIDPTIKIDLKYAKEDNFLNKNLYNSFKFCYLEKETAKKLSEAQKLLKAIDNGLSIVIFDGIRPRAVQSEMWKNVDLSSIDKQKFLAKPEAISMHNYGLAVDVSIVLADNTLLDMGTEFDFPGELAYPIMEDYFLDKGILGDNQIENRKLLRQIMNKAGFIANDYEWWHFSSLTKKEALGKYVIIESFQTFSSPKQEIYVQTTDKPIFKIQIAASKKKINSFSSIKDRTSISYYEHENLYKYTFGNYNDPKNAFRIRDSLRKCCINQAFIVCFYNSERIPINKALRLLEK